MTRQRIWLQSLLFGLLSSRAATLSIQPDALLFDRQNTCAPNTNACGNGLPSNFCCGSDSTCIVLAGNTTVLCCPKPATPASGDGTCSQLRPITCDLSQQNATQFPASGIKTTALHGELPSCGGSCCPFGYSCNTTASSGPVCQKDANQNAAPSQSDPSSTTPSTSSATASGLAGSKTSQPAVSVSEIASQSSATSSPSPTAAPTSSDDPNKKTAAIVGSVSAIIGVLLIMFLVWYCLRKRRRNIQANGDSGTIKRGNSVKSSHSVRSWGNTGPLPVSPPRMTPRRIRTDQIQAPEPIDVQRTDFSAILGGRASQDPPRTPESRRSQTSSMTGGIKPLRLPQKVGLAGNTLTSGGGGVDQSPRSWERRAAPPRTPENRVDSGMTVPFGLRDDRDSVFRGSTMTDWGGLMKQADEQKPPLPGGSARGEPDARRR
jgi:hypothetical protein